MMLYRGEESANPLLGGGFGLSGEGGRGEGKLEKTQNGKLQDLTRRAKP